MNIRIFASGSKYSKPMRYNHVIVVDQSPMETAAASYSNNA